MLNIELYKQNRPHIPGYGKYFPKIQHPFVVTSEKIAMDIQQNCSVKRSDIDAVIVELGEALFNNLRDGNIVQLNNIGRFKLSVRGNSVDAPEDFKLSRDIFGVNCKFKPYINLLGQNLYHNIEYQMSKI